MTGRSVPDRLDAYMHAYRQLGPWRGTAAAARRIMAVSRGHLRRHTLRRRPIVASPADVGTALGGWSASEALSAAGAALPSVTGWETGLERLSAEARAELVRRADDILDHRFDLLGSGLVDLGPEIDWHRDFKSGRVWPRRHISQIEVSYPDTSDIKVPWELSRAQHLPVLAAAYRLTAEVRYLDEIGAQLRSWIAANPVEFGVNWACTMDVAIRAVNWIATLVVALGDRTQPAWVDEVVGSLLLHGRFIRGHLESGDARGNHYLSDVVGLLVVSSVFARSAEGRRWAEWSVRELGREAQHQIRADGCDHEASIAYHRLVAELFIVGADAADAVLPGRLPSNVRPTVDAMLTFANDYIRPDGLAPQIGDVDNGRLLPLGDYGSDQRSHLHLFAQARRPYAARTTSAAYRDGGFFIMRAGALYAAVRCGDVGIHGRGCHAHNDLLGFELCYDGTPVVIDPGSYLYTADPPARNLFRSTRMHSTLQIDGAEQNELREDRLFAMVDRASPELLEWTVTSDEVRFRGRHHGFAHLPDPAVHTRTLRLLAGERCLEIEDLVRSSGPHALEWTFPVGDAAVAPASDGVTVSAGEVRLLIDSGGLAASIETGWYSPGYGTRLSGTFVRFRARSEPGEHQHRFRITPAK